MTTKELNEIETKVRECFNSVGQWNGHELQILEKISRLFESLRKEKK